VLLNFQSYHSTKLNIDQPHDSFHQKQFVGRVGGDVYLALQAQLSSPPYTGTVRDLLSKSCGVETNSNLQTENFL